MKTKPEMLEQAARQALEALEHHVEQTRPIQRTAEAITALCEALERPDQAAEPVFAFRHKGLDDFCTCTKKRYKELSLKPNLFETRIFYTTPQPARQPLPPASPCAMTEAEYRLFKLGWLEAEAAHGIT